MRATDWSKLCLVMFLLMAGACGSDDKETSTPTDTVEVTVPDDTIDVPPPPSDVPPVDTADAQDECTCHATEHCDDSGACTKDVCVEGAITCESSEAVQICNEDGSGFEWVPCDEGDACYLGECTKPLCDPEDPPTCEEGQQKICNGLGLAYNLIPCPGGMACNEGQCVPIESNVILLLDTSGSMNAMNPQGDMPKDCTGENCPPWEWPSCDDATVPKTRLGKAKKALQSVLEGEATASVRMALQRFPQIPNIYALAGTPAPNCAGYMKGMTLWSGHQTTSHEVDLEVLEGPSLYQIMPVPFSADGTPSKDSMLPWIDFQEDFSISEKNCGLLPTNCPSESGQFKACISGKCAVQTMPELRADGETPLGRGLFYAGEIIRHLVVVEGRACAADADCGSPHYTCVSGQCRDPYRACRPNVIVIFTDGAETVSNTMDKLSSEVFFHPRIQAKRLHYGLACTTDSDCLNGAVCHESVCRIPEEGMPKSTLQAVDETKCYKGEIVDDSLCNPAPAMGEACCRLKGVCHRTDVPCANNDPCFEKYKYPCGPAQTCSGKCEVLGTSYVDQAQNADVLRDAEGVPISVTVHVVDASGAVTGNSLIAALGGGQHVPVALENVASIIDAFVPLLDIKANPNNCGP